MKKKLALLTLICTFILSFSAMANYQECKRRVELTYFKMIDSALLTFQQQKQKCLDMYSKPDFILSCIQSAEKKKDAAVKKAKMYKRSGLLNCRRYRRIPIRPR